MKRQGEPRWNGRTKLQAGLLIAALGVLVAATSLYAQGPTFSVDGRLSDMVKPVAGSVSSSTLETQKDFKRVRQARQDRSSDIDRLFAQAQIAYPPKGLFLRAFKEEDILEAWVPGADGRWVKLKEYEVCRKSGELGPKRTEGDSQVPEGVYTLDRYNPNSSFHLSLGLNYPNESDRKLGTRPYGGDIFIHGSCVTIGCLPLTDRWIEELYLIALDTSQAKAGRIPVHLFPRRMDEDGMKRLGLLAGDDAERLAFWRNLKTLYDAFEKTKVLPKVSVNGEGRYVVTER